MKVPADAKLNCGQGAAQAKLLRDTLHSSMADARVIARNLEILIGPRGISFAIPPMMLCATAGWRRDRLPWPKRIRMKTANCRREEPFKITNRVARGGKAQACRKACP